MWDIKTKLPIPRRIWKDCYYSTLSHWNVFASFVFLWWAFWPQQFFNAHVGVLMVYPFVALMGVTWPLILWFSGLYVAPQNPID